MPQKSEIQFKDTISASHIIVSFLIDEENFQTCRIFQQGLKNDVATFKLCRLAHK